MKLPIIIAGLVTGAGIMTIGAVALASGQRRRVNALLARGRFVRGLIMDRVTQDGRVVPHWGIDIAAPEGTPVFAVKSGRVVLSRPLRGYGNTVMISHSDGRQSSLYGHLARSLVNEGQQVSQGQEIAQVGSTRHGRNVRWDGQQFVSVGPESAGAVGRPISPHIHFEIHPGTIPRIGSRPRRLDPVRWLRSQGISQYAQRWEREAVDRVA